MALSCLTAWLWSVLQRHKDRYEIPSLVRRQADATRPASPAVQLGHLNPPLIPWRIGRQLGDYVINGTKMAGQGEQILIYSPRQLPLIHTCFISLTCGLKARLL